MSQRTPWNPSEKQRQELEERLYKLSWEGSYWGWGGAIAVSKKLFRLNGSLKDRLHRLSGISSTYYSATGNAAARAENTRWFYKPWWIIQAILCFRKAVKFSDQLERKVGLKGMRHDELDIRASILRKGKRYRESLRCSEEALSRAGVPLDSQVLLRIGKFESLSAEARESGYIEFNDGDKQYEEVGQSLPFVRPTTAVRFHRSFAQYCASISLKEKAATEFIIALRIAQENGLGDQVEKIKAVMPPALREELFQ